MAPPTQPPKASLQGIPRELRRQIYDNILEQNADCYVPSLSRDRDDKWTPDSELSPALPNKGPSSLRMPIGNLAMTCSSLAEEIRDHIRTLPASRRVAVVEISGDQVGLRRCFIQKMPCPVVDLTLLKVEVRIGIGNSNNRDFPLRECPSNLTCELINMLRHLFHRRRGLLKRATGVADVQVFLKVSKYYHSTVSDNGCRELAQEVRFLSDIGLEDSSGGKLFGERNVRLMD